MCYWRFRLLAIEKRPHLLRKSDKVTIRLYQLEKTMALLNAAYLKQTRTTGRRNIEYNISPEVTNTGRRDFGTGFGLWPQVGVCRRVADMYFQQLIRNGAKNKPLSLQYNAFQVRRLGGCCRCTSSRDCIHLANKGEEERKVWWFYLLQGQWELSIAIQANVYTSLLLPNCQ
jgi:hypothetical protein